MIIDLKNRNVLSKRSFSNETTKAIDAKALFEMTCATHLSFNR